MERCIKFNRGTKALLLFPGPSFPGKVELQQGIPAASLGTSLAGHITASPVPIPVPVLLFPLVPAPQAPPGALAAAEAPSTGGGTGRGCSHGSARGVSLSLLLPLDAKAGSVLHRGVNI